MKRLWNRAGLPMALALLMLGGTGCPRVRGNPTPIPEGWNRASTVIEMEPLRIDLTPGAEGGWEATLSEAEPLFEDALERVGSGDLAAAGTLFQKVADTFVDSRFALAARYNAGLMHEALGDFSSAAIHYEKAASLRPGTPDAADALFRLGHCLGRTGDWERVRAIYSDVLVTYELNGSDTVEAQSRLGAALYHLGDLGGAEAHARAAVDFYAEREKLERLEHSYFVAQAQFTLGEVLRERSASVKLDASDRTALSRDLEARSRLLLEARHAYLATVVHSNLYWASAAGMRMGELFEEYRRAIIEAPLPAELETDDAKDAYRMFLSDELDPVIYRARTVYLSTLAMAARTGARNEWIDAAADRLDRLRDWMVEQSWLGAPAADATAGPRLAEVAVRNGTDGTIRINLVGFVKDERSGKMKKITPVAEIPPGGERVLSVTPARYAYEVRWTRPPAGVPAAAADAVFSGEQYFHVSYVYRAEIAPPPGSVGPPFPAIGGAPSLPPLTPSSRPGLSLRLPGVGR